MGISVSRQVARLPKLSRRQLLALWQELYGRAAPIGMRRNLLVPFLGYRLQEKAYGGLKPSIRTELCRMARALEKDPQSAKPDFRLRIKPGTRIVREWQGKTYEVHVSDAGFEYGGVGYRSLSQIARKITGTRWSGPAFFGLKKGHTAGSESDD